MNDLIFHSSDNILFLLSEPWWNLCDSKTDFKDADGRLLHQCVDSVLFKSILIIIQLITNDIKFPSIRPINIVQPYFLYLYTSFIG